MAKDLRNLPIREAIIEAQDKKIKKLSEALQKIGKQIDETGIKMVDTANPLQMALYHIKHLAKEAIKETNP